VRLAVPLGQHGGKLARVEIRSVRSRRTLQHEIVGHLPAGIEVDGARRAQTLRGEKQGPTTEGVARNQIEACGERLDEVVSELLGEVGRRAVAVSVTSLVDQGDGVAVLGDPGG
jgi:hypothetical protein